MAYVGVTLKRDEMGAMRLELTLSVLETAVLTD